MKFTLLALASAYTTSAAAVGERATYAVKGTPEGFGKGTTGGGNAACAIPSSVAQLKTWLSDSTARCIVLDREFNFKGTEGTTTAAGCRPASNKCPGNGGQDAINNANWCTNGNAGAGSKSITVTYDTAGTSAINLGSNKSIIGVGNKGVIRGKGLRIANGAKNVIIQNVHITELNPQYIWGGDAITLDGADLVWIDHVKISLIGRQMFVAGYGASNRVTISNTEFDGSTSWSATCDGRHYWAILLLGTSDLITMKGNYIHHTSGRSPKVGGNTLLHVVNNYFYSNTGHAFDNEAGGMVVAEGNVFQNVATPLLANNGKFFAAPSTSANAACQASLGHTCQLNAFGSSGSLTGTDTSFFGNFAGKNVASAGVASSGIANTAGVGKI
ncbi:Polysaccharide lyase family 1 protein [Pyrenophora tritici-repentis]|nr:Polysaccharide lyase family 1 protein [Pyrenophora tritici-repentis]KAI0614122.1 Polysaccharide lyase family 1 protein [Pyrenophora tritici-repentis]KAI0626238.1 Polysaccharide lyase family 1 protein [Pyrenophora tritici-repentis]KAI2481719.1 Polysaccharide lyase family 1 protein [Pyrenophora tritici-repentis]KAI2487952.1 Polysaccharide lyase family 1 protein [Pyrenophora tritici-repentis]